MSPLVRRLTRDEVGATVTDVFGLEPTTAELHAIPEDRPLEGFVNIATSQTAAPEHVAGYARLARSFSGRIADGFLRTRLACADASVECTASVVTSIGRFLFRRPVDSDELNDFSLLYGRGFELGLDFGGAARLVIEGMLQSPQFLYRLERETAAATGLMSGQVRNITGYEMATRLAYLAWGSAPDAALLHAAESGALDSPAGVSVELTRLLSDTERGKRSTARFMLDWGKLESLPASELEPELVGSLLAFYQDLVWTRQAPLVSALTARHAFLTPKLAQNLGLVPTGAGIQAYDLTGLPGRRGLLSQPGLVAGMTNADGGAIVARGLFLQSQLFCGATPSPPTSLQEQIDDFVAEQPAGTSDRKIAEVRLSRPQCGACHGMFDPLAYALERFDFEGRFREVDDFGNQLTTDGWIPGRFTPDGADQAYAGIDDYATLLEQLPRVRACLLQQQLQYALGRRLTDEQASLVAEIEASAAQGGGSYAAVLAAITAHSVFRELTVE